MPHIETVQVNDALADPGSPAASSEVPSLTESELRMREVTELGWLVTHETTQFGSPFGGCRPHTAGRWVMPTSEKSVPHNRIFELPDWSTFEEAVTEVVLFQSDPNRVRAFLVDDDKPNPSTRRVGRQLLIFSATET